MNFVLAARFARTAARFARSAMGSHGYPFSRPFISSGLPPQVDPSSQAAPGPREPREAQRASSGGGLEAYKRLDFEEDRTNYQIHSSFLGGLILGSGLGLGLALLALISKSLSTGGQ